MSTKPREVPGFCGEQLLVAYPRPSKIDGAKHAWAVLVAARPAVQEPMKADGLIK